MMELTTINTTPLYTNTLDGLATNSTSICGQSYGAALNSSDFLESHVEKALEGICVSSQANAWNCLHNDSAEALPETKCRMIVDEKTGSIHVRKYLKGKCIGEISNLLPDISDVRVIKDHNGSDRVVVVAFEDGSVTRATLDHVDVGAYSLESGLTVCIAKRLIEKSVGVGYGTSIFNKIIRRAMRVKRINDEQEARTILECERAEKRWAKLAEKKRRRDERKAAEKREAEIEIQKEAYLRAMREFRKEYPLS